MRAWLKGGLIGGLIVIIFLLIMFFRSCDTTEIIGEDGCSWSFQNFIDNLTHLFNEVLIVKTIFIGIILGGFILGFLVGFIIGKIKSRRKQK